MKLTEQERDIKNSILTYQERISAYRNIMEEDEEGKLSEEKLKGIYTGVINEDDIKMMSDIVHKHIVKVTSTAEWFGKERDKRAVRQNAQMITIETALGDIHRFIYVARKYKNHHFWHYREDGKEIPVLSIHKIHRESGKCVDSRAFKKISKW